jgi:hypothetical protein
MNNKKKMKISYRMIMLMKTCPRLDKSTAKIIDDFIMYRPFLNELKEKIDNLRVDEPLLIPVCYYNKKLYPNPEIVYIHLFIRPYCFECCKYYDRVKMPSFVQLKNIDELFHTHPFFPTTYNKYDESDDESDDDWL